MKDGLNFPISLTHSKITKDKFAENISYPYSTEHWNVKLFPNYSFLYFFMHFTVESAMHSARCQALLGIKNRYKFELNSRSLWAHYRWYLRGLKDMNTCVFCIIRWGRMLQVLKGFVQIKSSTVNQKVKVLSWASVFKEAITKVRSLELNLTK